MCKEADLLKANTVGEGGIGTLRYFHGLVGYPLKQLHILVSSEAPSPSALILLDSIYFKSVNSGLGRRTSLHCLVLFLVRN